MESMDPAIKNNADNWRFSIRSGPVFIDYPLKLQMKQQGHMPMPNVL